MAFHGRELEGCVIRYKPTGRHDCKWEYAEIAHVERQKFLLVADNNLPGLNCLNINALNNRKHRLEFGNEFPDVPVTWIVTY